MSVGWSASSGRLAKFCLSQTYQESVHSGAADGALVALEAEHIGALTTEAHMTTRQHCCITRFGHADDTFLASVVIRATTSTVGRGGCRFRVLDPENLLELVRRALEPDLLLEHLHRIAALVVMLDELRVRCLRLHIVRQGLADMLAIAGTTLTAACLQADDQRNVLTGVGGQLLHIVLGCS
eukprot:scaffold3822_cov379-Prasinococcus_capsulatus_cf.AAC.3